MSVNSPSPSVRRRRLNIDVDIACRNVRLAGRGVVSSCDVSSSCEDIHAGLQNNDNGFLAFVGQERIAIALRKLNRSTLNDVVGLITCVNLPLCQAGPHLVDGTGQPVSLRASSDAN